MSTRVALAVDVSQSRRPLSNPPRSRRVPFAKDSLIHSLTQYGGRAGLGHINAQSLTSQRAMEGRATCPGRQDGVTTWTTNRQHQHQHQHHQPRTPHTKRPFTPGPPVAPFGGTTVRHWPYLSLISTVGGPHFSRTNDSANSSLVNAVLAVPCPPRRVIDWNPRQALRYRGKIGSYCVHHETRTEYKVVQEWDNLGAVLRVGRLLSI